MDESNGTTAGDPDEYTLQFACIVNPLEDGAQPAEQWKTLRAKLEADPRVDKLTEVGSASDTFISRSYSPAWSNTDDSDQDIKDAKRSTGTLRSFGVYKFDVHVPEKNQQTFGLRAGQARLPEDYVALYDGLLLAVAWRTAPDVNVIDAGRVVRDLVLDAAKAASPGAHIQGPSFAHCAVNLTSSSDLSSPKTERLDNYVGPELELAYPAGTQLAEMMLDTWRRLSFSLHSFYEQCDDQEALMIFAGVMSSDLVELLENQYTLSGHPLTIDPRTWWRQIADRELRQKSRRLIARIWLCAAKLEEGLQGWRTNESRFADSDSDGTAAHLLRRDRSEHNRHVESLVLGTTLDATAHASSELNSRSLVIATAIGLAIGLIAGVILGVL